MTIDHSQVTVSNDSYPEQLKLYTETLKPLGYEVRMQFGPYHTGFGSPASDLSDYKRANFWLTGIEDKPNYKTHLAFTASDRAQVDAFHAAAMKNGGTDNGAPGPRPHYHSNYYAAFFTDAAGNNIECVCHDAPSS